MATVVIPALLRKLTDGKDRVTAHGRNLGQLIADLDRQFPGLSEHLIDEGEIKPSIAVSIDGEMGTAGVLEPVRESSEVFFIPAIGGGSLIIEADETTRESPRPISPALPSAQGGRLRA